MEPKTDLQRKVVRLSIKLGPITPKQIEYGYRKCQDFFVVRSRKTLFCLDCGHSWADPGIDQGCQCPGCEQHLNLKLGYRGQFSDECYYGVMTTKKGMQVVRVVLISKDMKKGQKAQMRHKEVMQHWVSQDGKITTMSMLVNGFSPNMDSWIHSELEVREAYTDKAKWRHNIFPLHFYPGRSVLPVFKRNGFKGYFYGITPQFFFSYLVQRPKFETLLKAGQIQLLKHTRGEGRVEKYWDCIKIAIRNNYLVKDPGDWFDYLKLLDHFGKDLRNAKYVLPADLKTAHDRYVKKKKRQDKLMHVEELRKRMAADQVEYEKEKARFLDLCFSDGEIEVKTIPTVEEFMREGEELEHCVFTNEYYKEVASLVLSARIGDKRVETVEVSLSDMDVVQARGIGNEPTMYHDQIVNLVRSNMNKISERVSN